MKFTKSVPLGALILYTTTGVFAIATKGFPPAPDFQVSNVENLPSQMLNVRGIVDVHIMAPTAAPLHLMAERDEGVSTVTSTTRRTTTITMQPTVTVELAEKKSWGVRSAVLNTIRGSQENLRVLRLIGRALSQQFLTERALAMKTTILKHVNAEVLEYLVNPILPLDKY
ncbi:uncharacterized protein BCR38DRAFT_413836 [Pseudomassariella vexata]|uniref:Uncharacterized protein n=1 Tax=Pseudomassariella vexata TaxID=1141098 RepID=A0A1Y2DDS1_9PEZI|nr:uncharacterized protein BCR38DRAFT_413836 [Pseudomassariella vexata]ORY57433.1 hypothetical protein BCR38DRAFT_413836 [Pseudomassariella vexata]